MTNQEALERYQGVNKDCCGCVDREDEVCENCEQYYAIKALEKQIPKKPIEEADVVANITFYKCPACGKDVYHIKGLHPVIQVYDHHCTCGQAIDWSEE